MYAQRGNVSIAQLLLNKGASIAKPSLKLALTALFACACVETDALKGLNMAHFLCSHGAELTAHDKQGFTLLHHAAKSGKTDLITYYLSKIAIDPVQDLYRPLWLAARKGQAAAAQLLLEKGAKQRLHNDEHSDILAVTIRDLQRSAGIETIQVLIRHETCIVEERTLHIALESESVYRHAIVEELLRHGVSPRASGHDETPPLEAYLTHRPFSDLGILELLLESGSNPNAGLSTGRTPLTHICSTWWLDALDQERAISTLVYYGADTSLPDQIGDTPMMALCLNPSTRNRLAEVDRLIRVLIREESECLEEIV